MGLFILLAELESVARWEGFYGLSEGQIFVVLLVLIGCTTGIVVALARMIASVSDSVHRRRSDSELKREMLDRGMSADEIARVIEASAPLGPKID